VTPGLPLGQHPCNPFALVASPKLGLRHCYSLAQVDLIANEHKALIHAHRCELVLKDGIDSFSKQFKFQGWLVFTWCSILESDGILWCRCNAFCWNQYSGVRLFDPALGEGFVSQALIELWIRRSHAGKIVLVHRAVPTLINANQ